MSQRRSAGGCTLFCQAAKGDAADADWTRRLVKYLYRAQHNPRVREHFEREKIAYDYALVSTELATLHLEQDRTQLVQELDDEMFWIFDSLQVHQEALAAFTLFCRAARLEEAEAEWTRRLVKYLYSAQHDPAQRFGG